MKTLFKKWVARTPYFFRACNARGLLLSIVALSPFNAYANTPSPSDNKHVLYINSYHQGYAWSDDIEKGLRDTFAATRGTIEVSTIYLDSQRYTQEALTTLTADMVALKKNEKLIDLIVVSDAPAIEFALDNQTYLFSRKPIVATSIADYPSIEKTSESSITGISALADYKAPIDLALSLHPNTQSIVFVGSKKAQHNQRLLDTIQVDVIPRLSDYAVKALVDEPLSSLQSTLDAQPSNTLVFLLSDTFLINAELDGLNSATYSPAETARIVSSMTNLPVYSYWHAHLGHGIIGGQFATGFSQGKAAAQLAVSLLENQFLTGSISTEDYPFKPAPAALFFDAEMTAKHGISTASLPNGARIINPPTPIWQVYKTEVLVTLIVVFALISAVLGFFLLTRRQNDTIHHISDENSELNHALDVNKETLVIVEHQLEEVTTVDPLTGLSNDKHFNNMLDKELKRATRYKTSLTLLLLTFDDYSDFVGVYGESNAEKQLAKMGKMIATSCQRSSDLLAYRGKGSFAIILPHTTCDNALIVCEKLHDQLKKEALPFDQSQTGMMTISIGVSSMEGNEQNVFPDSMLSLSKAMCEEAQKYGGNVTRSALISTDIAPNTSE